MLRAVQAREAIEKCSGQGSAVPERNFHPALVGFCMRRDAGGALGVLALIDQQARAGWRGEGEGERRAQGTRRTLTPVSTRCCPARSSRGMRRAASGHAARQNLPAFQDLSALVCGAGDDGVCAQKLDPSEYAYARVVEALASSSSSSLAQQEDAGASSWSRLQGEATGARERGFEGAGG